MYQNKIPNLSELRRGGAKSWTQQIGTLAHWQISTLSLPLHRENTHPLVFKSTTVPWEHRDSRVYTCL
jgi:hypothetical protein